MACNIIKNKSGVQSVTAPNGQNSNLYQDIIRMPFIKNEEDALTYHSKAQDFASEDYLTDSNGEPILMFRARNASDELAISDKFVYTTSFSDVMAADKTMQGIEAGFIKKKDSLQTLDTSTNPRNFFVDTRAAARDMQEGGQILSSLSDYKSILVTDSANDFTPLVQFNRNGDTKGYNTFINTLVNSEFVENEKVKLSEVLEYNMPTEQNTGVEVNSVELSDGTNIFSLSVEDEMVVKANLKPYLDGFEVSSEEIMVDTYEGTNLTNLYHLAFAQTKKPIYSKSSLTASEQAVWEKLSKEKVAKKVGNRYVLTKKYNNRPVTKDIDITIAELKKDGTVEVNFNHIVPHYRYKGKMYLSKGAMRLAVKADVRNNKVSSTTSNNSTVFKLTDSVFQGPILEQADFMFGTADFITMFEKDGEMYMMVDDKHVDQLTSPVKVISTVKGDVEVNVQEEQEKAKRGETTANVEGIERVLENETIEEIQKASRETEEKSRNNDSQSLNGVLQNFLTKMGISTTTMQDYRNSYNERYDIPVEVQGIADLLNRVVVLSNDADISVLTEEVAHFAVEYFNNQEDISAMLKDVDKTQAYKTYAESYRKEYSKKLSGEALEAKVRKEVLGKILSTKIRENFKDNSTTVEEKGIFATLRALLEKFLDLFKVTDTNAEFFQDFGKTLDQIVQGMASDPATVFRPSTSSEFYFSIANDKEQRELNAHFQDIMLTMQERYKNQRGLEVENEQLGSAINDLITTAEAAQFGSAIQKFLVLLNKDMKKSRTVISRAEELVKGKATLKGKTLAGKELDEAILNSLPSQNIVNIISASEGLTDELQLVEQFLRHLQNKGVVNATQVDTLNKLMVQIRNNHGYVSGKIDQLAKAQAKMYILNLAKKQGISDTQLANLQSKLEALAIKDMTSIAVQMHSPTDMISNPFLHHAILELEKAKNYEVQSLENYLVNFLNLQSKLRVKEGTFFKLAVDGSHFASPIHLDKFLDSLQEELRKKNKEYKEIMEKRGLSEESTDPNDIKQLNELQQQLAFEREEITKKYYMQKYVEKEGQENKLVNRSTVNPITGKNTRTAYAQAQLRDFAKRKRKVYDRYRSEDGSYTHNFSMEDRVILADIASDMNTARSIYHLDTGQPKTGDDLATALDLIDYYESFSNEGGLSEDARKSYLLAREVAKERLGADTKEFRAWESMFTIETYGEINEDIYTPTEISQDDLIDQMGIEDYRKLIANIRRNVSTEGVAEEDITPTFLFEALKRKKRELLKPYRRADLGNEVDGRTLEEENQGDSILISQLDVINSYLRKLSQGRALQEESEGPGYILRRIPNRSFIAKYDYLELMDEKNGTTQLDTWLNGLGISNKGKKWANKYPIPNTTDYYSTYIRIAEVDGNQYVIPKQKSPSFFWESMHNSELELNPDYNVELEGKLRQPSLWAMEEFKNEDYFDNFGIDESTPWSNEATENTEVFEMLKFFQDSKYDVDRLQGIKGNYYLRPQVRTEGGEQIESLFNVGVISTLKNYLQEKFIIDSTDTDFGTRVIVNKDGTQRRVQSLKSVPRYFHIRKDPNVLSRDISLSMGQYMKMGFSHIYRTKALLNLKVYQRALEATSYKKNLDTTKTIPGVSSNYAEALRSIIDRDVFGNRYHGVFKSVVSQKPVTIEVGGKERVIVPAGISAEKSAITFSNYLKSLRMSAHLFVPIRGYLSGLVAASQLGREGKLTTTESQLRAIQKYSLSSMQEIFDETTGAMRPRSYVSKLMHHVGIGREINDMFAAGLEDLDSGKQRVKRKFRNGRLGNVTGFSLFHKRQTIMAITGAIDNLRLHDGNFVNKVQFTEMMFEKTDMSRSEINKAWRELSDKTYDSFLIEEDNKVTLDRKGLRDAGFTGDFNALQSRVRGAAVRARQNIDYSLSDNQSALIKRYPVLGELVLMFKNYFYIGIGGSYKQAGYDAVLGFEDEGKRRTSGLFYNVKDTFTGQRSVSQFANAIVANLMAAMPFSSTLGFAEAYMDKTTKFSEAQKRNIIRVGTDIKYAVLGGLGLILTYLYAMGDDGEEDESVAKELLTLLAQGVFTEHMSTNTSIMSIASHTKEVANLFHGAIQIAEYAKILDLLGFESSTKEEKMFKPFWDWSMEEYIPFLNQFSKWSNFVGESTDYADPAKIREKTNFMRNFDYASPVDKFIYKWASMINDKRVADEEY